MTSASHVSPKGARPGENSAGDWKLGALAVATVAALLYGGVYAPTQNQLRQLERQCDKLAKAVAELTTAGVSADRTSNLLSVLQEQGRQIAHAEASVEQLASLHVRLVQEAESVAKATPMFNDLENVRQAMAACGRTLSDAATALHEMADLSLALDASRELAREAKISLASLDALHRELQAGSSNLAAAAPVLEQVREFCGRVADSRSLVESAFEVESAAARLERQIVERGALLPEAERTCERMSVLCDQLGRDEGEIETAERRLSRLLKLKNGLLSRTLDLDDAEGALERLFDLRDRLARSAGTISDIQHLVVDIVLLQPSVERAMQTLRPMVEFTRLARRADGPVSLSASSPMGGVDANQWPGESLDVAKAIEDVID